jgi:hypothetical protein
MRTVGSDAEATLLGSLRERMVLVASGLGLSVRHDLDNTRALGLVGARVADELKDGPYVEPGGGTRTLTASYIRRSIEVTLVEVRANTGASAQAAFKSVA